MLSAYEQAKGFTRPLDSKTPAIVPYELKKAKLELVAKRKLNNILRSKSISEPRINVGDVIEIFIHPSKRKRKYWSQPKMYSRLMFQFVRTLSQDLQDIKCMPHSRILDML